MRLNNRSLELHIPDASTDEKLARFESGMRSYQVRPPGGDKYYASGAKGLSDGYYDSSTGIKPMIQEVIAATDFPTSYSLRKPADQIQFEYRNDPAYPYNHAEPASWENDYTDIATDRERREHFQRDFMYHVLDATVVSRVTPVPLATTLYADRFGVTPTMVDYGCGIALGAKKLASGMGSESFKRIILHASDQKYRDELEATIHIATVVTPSYKFSSITAVDKQPEPTPESIERTMVSSFTPEQWANPANLEQFMALVVANPEGVKCIWNTDISKTKRLPDTPIGGYNYGLSSTWWYMYRGKPVLNDIKKNELANLSDDGVLLVMEHGRPDKSYPGGINLLDNWYQPNIKRPYRMMVFDKLEPEAGFRTLYSFPSGRPKDEIAVSRYAAKRSRMIS